MADLRLKALSIDTAARREAERLRSARRRQDPAYQAGVRAQRQRKAMERQVQLAAWRESPAGQAELVARAADRAARTLAAKERKREMGRAYYRDNSERLCAAARQAYAEGRLKKHPASREQRRLWSLKFRRANPGYNKKREDRRNPWVRCGVLDGCEKKRRRNSICCGDCALVLMWTQGGPARIDLTKANLITKEDRERCLTLLNRRKLLRWRKQQLRTQRFQISENQRGPSA